MLDDNKMTEAEVSLELALYLIRNNLVSKDVTIALDGAQIRTGDSVHFNIHNYLKHNECTMLQQTNEWRGKYQVGDHKQRLIIHSSPGKGDVIATLKIGKTLRVESKKGPLVKSKSSQEYPLLREAIGQLMTIEEYNNNEILAIAVPYSVKFNELTSRWVNAPLIRKLGINFLLIKRSGGIVGIERILAGR